ncbi:MAG: phosphoribosylamine--glycine ligase [Acidobacteria bacterium]|nr:phosphoribosylamine--glycine ligase [Acidobacteriota bacterium]
MKALVIGSGGREHAIAWRLAQEPGVEVVCSPGNPGMQTLGPCVLPQAATPEAYLAVAAAYEVDLTVVGPEAPLVSGVSDAFLSAGKKIVGPSQAAAQLEASKHFAKQVMIDAGIPTARYRATTSIEEARAALTHFEYPLVLKADGLAAGKGVIIVHTRAEAEQALNALGSLGPKILLEEFLVGEEASFIALCDGHRALPLEASQDHKTIFDGDTGPNTGGMGAYCDGRVLAPEQTRQVLAAVIQPTLDHMRRLGSPFTGFLYAGLMMTASGPKVLEFNVRLGDPETQSLLHRIRGGFAESLRAAAHGDLRGAAFDWNPNPSVCVVMAAAGYPDKPRTGDTIHGIAAAEQTGAVVFQAGTRLNGNTLQTAGGRVLGVTASGETLQAAIRNVYAAVGEIEFHGMQFRNDIGAKGLKRWSRIDTVGT